MRQTSAAGIAGQLAGLAWPIVIARSTQVVVGVTDVRMVAHLGQDALAATGDGALNAFVLLVLPLGVVSIVSAFTSQLTGAGSPGAARRFAVYGLFVALSTQVTAIALLPSIPWALSRLDYTPALAALMAAYLRVRLFSAGAAVGLEALGCHYAGRGNTRLPMLAALSALLLNVAGNWLLIDGHCGLPALGVTGSALASTIATTCAFVGLLGVFVLDRGAARDPGASLSARELVHMLRVGLPVGVSGFLEVFAFAFFVNVVVASFGTTTLAALLAVLQVSALATLPAFACASAGAVLVGNAIGARAGDEVPRLVGITLAGATVWQVMVGLAYLLLARPILTLLVGTAPSAAALVEQGASLLVLSAAWTLCEALGATYAEALSAAGDTTVTLWARAALFIAVLAPGAFVLVRWMGAGFMAVILWFIACAALVVAILRRRFHGDAWRHIHLTRLAGTELHATAGT